jgi:hypothetical protein
MGQRHEMQGTIESMDIAVQAFEASERNVPRNRRHVRRLLRSLKKGDLEMLCLEFI